MKRWVSVAVMCLIGAPAANAEYIIIRVLLNKSAPGTNTGTNPNPPGFPGIPALRAACSAALESRAALRRVPAPQAV